MKVINGIIHYTATEVSQLCGVSTQTIKLWNKASEQREEAGEGRLIPAPHTEPNGYKYWSGDNVVVVISDTFSGIGKYIGTVIKKTPSGMVYVRCCGVISRYKRDGEEYGKRDPYSRRRKYLIESTEEEQKKIALQRKRSQMEAYLKDYKYADLSYEDLEKVCKMLEALKEKSS